MMNVLPKLVKAKNCLLAVLVLSGALFAQTYQPYQNPKIQLLDSNGVIASGYSLCTFAAGTTTPQATYADSSGTVNPNPAVLDSAGRATIYLGPYSYKFILYAAGGTGCPNSAAQIWTQDNIYDTAQLTEGVLIDPAAGVSQTVAQAAGTTFAIDVSGGASFSVGSTVTASPFSSTSITSKAANKVQYVDGFAGSDWCAQVIAAYTGFPGYVLAINNNVSNMNACSAELDLPANTVLEFIQPGTYVLGANSVVPKGANVAVRGLGWNTVLSYTGSGTYAIDVNTQPNSDLEFFQITLGTAAAGGVRYQHQTSGSNANEYVRRVRVFANTYTAGQIGVDLHNHTLNDSNYRNDLEFFTDNIDIGAQFDSDVNSNGSNGNRLRIACNAQSRCVNMLDGTDNQLTIEALGAHNFSVGSLTLTSVAAGTGTNAVYTGTITGGATNALVGTVFHVTGFTNAGNNGWFIASASSGTTITAVNAGVVGETHAGAAIAGGIAFDACDVGTAGYGVLNNTAWITSEQGGGSGTVVINAGNGTCGSSSNFFGNSNDATSFSDANGKAFAFFGNALYQPVIANNSFCMGGQCSASDVAVVRNSTFFDFMLGDQSAWAGGRFSFLAFADGSGSAATDGDLRLPNSGTISFRNNANSGNVHLSKDTSDKMNFAGALVIGSAALTTTAAVSDAVTIASVSSSSRCSLTATNATAATNIATSYISSKTTGSVTVTHTATSGMTYEIVCTGQ